jgi:hypothetical protein
MAAIARDNVTPLLDGQIVHRRSGFMSASSAGLRLSVFRMLSFPAGYLCRHLCVVCLLISNATLGLFFDPFGVSFTLFLAVLTGVCSEMGKVLVSPLAMRVRVFCFPFAEVLQFALPFFVGAAWKWFAIKNEGKGDGMIQPHHNLIRCVVTPLDVPPSQGLFVFNYTIDSPLVVS